MKVASIKRGWKAGIITLFLTFDNGFTGEVSDCGYRGHPNRPGIEYPATVTVRSGRDFALVSMPHHWNPAIGDAVPAPARWNG